MVFHLIISTEKLNNPLNSKESKGYLGFNLCYPLHYNTYSSWRSNQNKSSLMSNVSNVARSHEIDELLREKVKWEKEEKEKKKKEGNSMSRRICEDIFCIPAVHKMSSSYKEIQQHTQKLLDVASMAVRFQRISFLKGDYLALSLCVFLWVPQVLQIAGWESTSECFFLTIVPNLEIYCQQEVATCKRVNHELHDCYTNHNYLKFSNSFYRDSFCFGWLNFVMVCCV